MACDQQQVYQREGVTEMKSPSGEGGQTLVEYALILVLIAIVVIAIYLLVEPALGSIIEQVKGGL
jgi:Flp pilus assembly pilin Flp